MRVNQQTLAQAVAELNLYPQVLLNVRVAKGRDYLGHHRIKEIVAAAEDALSENGRVLLRSSGTEPLLRVMVEGIDRQQVQRWAEAIAQEVREVMTVP